MAHYSLNPCSHITFDSKYMHVWDEKNKRSISWSKIDATREVVENSFRNNQYNDLSDALIRQLIETNVLLEESRPDDEFLDVNRQYGYFSKLTSNPTEALKRIEESRVLILGLGGTGGAVLQHLVGAGVRHFSLVDYDTVEVSNLNRQYSWESGDIGTLKVECARRYIKKRIAEANVNIHVKKIESSYDMSNLIADARPDLAVVAIDQPQGIQFFVQQWCYHAGIASIGGAVGVQLGHWGPLLLPAAGPIWKEWEAYIGEQSKFGQNPSGRVHRPITKWSFGPTNAIVAAHISLVALHYLAGVCKGTKPGVMSILDFENQNVTLHNVLECPDQ